MRLSWAEAYRLIPDLDAILAAQGNGPRKPRGEGAVRCPVAVQVEASPGRWLVRVANWCPASDNERARGLKRWIRAKKRDEGVVRDWLVGFAGIPRATGKRRLTVLVEKKGQRPDPSNLNKSLRDALVNCGLLVDDKSEWLEGSDPIVGPGKITATTIVLEDIP